MKRPVGRFHLRILMASVALHTVRPHPPGTVPSDGCGVGRSPVARCALRVARCALRLRRGYAADRVQRCALRVARCGFAAVTLPIARTDVFLCRSSLALTTAEGKRATRNA